MLSQKKKARSKNDEKDLIPLRKKRKTSFFLFFREKCRTPVRLPTRPMDLLKKKIEYLSGFVLEDRYETMKRVLSQRTRYMTVCLENFYHAQNGSAVIRSCEAFGVQDLHVVEQAVPFLVRDGVVKGTDKWVDIRKYHGGVDPALEMVRRLKAEGYRIVATSPHAGRDSTPEAFDVEKGRFALVFGAERDGISDTVRRHADEFLHVPMQGFVESLNVSVCAGILLYRLSARLKASAADWRLSEKERDELLFRWLFENVRDAETIMGRFGGYLRDPAGKHSLHAYLAEHYGRKTPHAEEDAGERGAPSFL